MVHPKRYHSLIILLHWLMAIGVFMMLVMGLTMGDITDKAVKFQIIQWHKSGGVILLLALTARLVIRLLTHAPQWPVTMKPIEKMAAFAGHMLLYVLLGAMVTSGWVMVSSSAFGLPTIVFGWFEWPHIPAITGNKLLHDSAEQAHGIIAYLLMMMIAVHIAAVIKHYVFDKDNLLVRMWWKKGSGTVAVLVLSTCVAVHPHYAEAKAYSIAYPQSVISFTGEHAGNVFKGKFGVWTAQVEFDPDNLAASVISAEIDLDSANTDNALFDGTLPQADWFNVAQHPKASFQSTVITRIDQSHYTVEGKLTMRGITKPLRFDMELSDLATSPVQVNAAFEINRMDYEMGAQSDPTAEWVSRFIKVKLEIMAQ